ncbi:MAG: M28 family peptidase [Clostridia bacterium]|nr:M28 family peptidase [Clostridia bacterium]
MKKISIYLFVVLCTISIVFANLPMAYADTNSYDFGLKSYEYAREFVSENPDRKAVADTVDNNASEYLYNFAKLYTNQCYIDEFIHAEDLEHTTLTTGRNVYVEIGDMSESIILIMSHYDNYYVDEADKNEGFYNATSIGLTMSFVEYFSENIPSDYGVFIAFLDAEEIGAFGSERLCSYLIDKGYLDKILLSIDLEYVGGGDNLYLYSDELCREHETYFMQTSTITSLTPVPNNKNVFYVANNSGLNYLHPGLNTSNSYFYAKDIPCMTFLGGYWANDGTFFLESEINPSIMYTKLDNFDNFDSVYGASCKLRLSQLGESIVVMVDRQDFVDTMISSKTNQNFLLKLQKSAFDRLICIPVILGIVIIIVLRYKNLLKKSTKSSKSTPSQSNTTQDKKVFEEFGL